MILAAATATQASANDHFQITLVVLAAGLAAIGWMIRHLLAQSSERHVRVDGDINAVEKRLGELEEAVASLMGFMNRRRWWQR